MPEQDENARVYLSDEDAGTARAQALLDSAGRALALAEDRLGLTLDAPARIRSIAPESAFYATLGRRPHNIVAVALPGENLILINRQPFMDSGRAERRRVLVHEFTHLLLGRRIPGVLPRWLDEGLAMIAAGDASLGDHARLAVAATFGGLTPLDELSGPRFGIRDQELAYAESISAARFYLKLYGAGDDPARFVRRLADPAEGEPLRSLLADPGYIRILDRRWRESIQSFWSWLAALTSGGIFWLALSGLFLLAYWRKRRMDRATVESWREEPEIQPEEEAYDNEEIFREIE